jgi:AGZA family xanthine/uracil permease-like MFS transporter
MSATTDNASAAPVSAPNSGVMPWFVRGDVDGFFGLALDNLIQLLLIVHLCVDVLKFPTELVYGRILPGAAISVLVGNLFYAWQARELSRKTGRTDICALPYGINTVSVFGHVFLVMLPALIDAAKSGAPDPARVAWHAGLAATIGSALIEGAGAFFAEAIRRATPRAALLSTLAGIALTFISLGFLFQSFARPEVGLSTLAVVMLIYFGRVKFKGGIPGGLVAVVIGVVIAHFTGIETPALPHTGAQPPVFVLSELIESFKQPYMLRYISVILPMGIFNVIGSLQNIESAEAAGDSYKTMPSLLVNGVGSLAAACFGSCFPTTIYIGHPGWKALGARAGYSILNGVVLTVLCVSGLLAYVAHYVPIDAGMAIVLWIGIVITAQAFQACPREHAPAVVIGLLPGVAAWGVLMARAGWMAAGKTFENAPIKEFMVTTQTYIHGAFALEQGFIFTAMILAAATVNIIERRFHAAALWFASAGIFSGFGLIHTYAWKDGNSVNSLGAPGLPWVWGYCAMAALMLIAPYVTVEGEGH